MNVVPGFWEWLTSRHPNIQLQSILSVYDELTNNKSKPDKLAKWVQSNKDYFISTDSQ